MRKIFIETLVELARRDPRVMLLTADLGYMAVEPFQSAHPDRFFNVGVAEQNMLGVATGLAEAGFIPFVYSIAPFVVLRPYEFIRNGPLAHNLPVRIAGVGGGYDYAHNGITHHALEDLAVMRTQPGMTVVAPADSAQMKSALLATWDRPGPVYYRVSKGEGPDLPEVGGRFAVDQVLVSGPAAETVFVTTGAVAREVFMAAEDLRRQGTACQVIVAACLNPSPSADLAKALKGKKRVFSVEEHYVAGGLGSLVAEVMSENALGGRLHRFGVRTMTDGVSGGQKWYYQSHGFSRETIVKTVNNALKETP